MGIAQKELSDIEHLHPEVEIWSLNTISEEDGNCHPYEKIGYKKAGRSEKINTTMTLVFYEKKTKAAEPPK